ncbi:MAG TPA: hypothetical protein VIK91_19295 [Nannocystis sp.]
MLATYFGSRPALLGLATLVALAACGNSGNSTASASEASATSDTSASTTDVASSSGASNSESDSDSGGTGSASMTSAPTTTHEPTTGSSATSSTSTGEPDPSTSTPVSTTDSGTTTDTTDSTTDTTDTSSTSGPDCIPTEEICNEIDDDCDGIIDNVDVGGDGICDCLDIALFGNQGANPSSEFQTWLEAQGTQVDRISIDNTPITAEILADYDIIILDWLVRTYTPEEAALIEAWVNAGGGLMSMTGHTNNNTVVERPNSIIAPMGLSYNASAGFFNGPVTNWTPHPLTDGITSVSFYGGLYIDIADDGIGENTIIGTLPPGPVAVAQVRQNGKLFIFGDEWIEFDSEWQNIPQIKKFWVNILGWLKPQNFCTVPQ